MQKDNEAAQAADIQAFKAWYLAMNPYSEFDPTKDDEEQQEEAPEFTDPPCPCPVRLRPCVDS